MLLIVLAAVTTNAQDIIVKNDKTELKAKILEITEASIKYKKFEMQDGPIYSILKTDVFMIIYQNGTKEYMDNKQTKPAAPTPQPTVPNKASTASTVTNAMSSNAGTTYQSSSSGGKQKQSHWGAEIGVLSTSASIGTNVTTEAVIRMRAGIYYAIPLSANVSLVPAVMIIGKGSHFSYYDGSYINEDINTSFIEIPLKFVYTTGGTKGWMLGAAPTVGIRIAQSEKGTVYNYSSGYNYSFSGSPGFKSTEISFSLLAGYRFSSKFALSLAYNTAFTNISNDYTSYKTNYLGANISFGF